MAAHASSLRARSHQPLAARGRSRLDNRRYRVCDRRYDGTVGTDLRRAARRIADRPGHRDPPPSGPYRGLAAWLTERWQVPLWASEKEWLYARLLTGNADDSAALRRDFARRAGLDAAARELFAEHSRGYRRGVPSVPSSFQRLSDGQLVEIGGRQWRVIIGEGHSPELACLYCGETGVLISGDQVLPRISPNVSVHAHEPDGDPLSRFLRSLAKLRALIPPETLVLPSHNLPFFGLQERVDALAAHHRARCEEVIAACREPRTAVELLPVLFRRPLDRHQTAFALGEALAHLHYLMGQGALARMLGADGANRFLRADG